jgi:hypothetical protein
MIGILRAVVPLAEATGGVSRLLKRLGDGSLVEIQALGARRDAVNAPARVPSAGEELGPGRRTDRLNEEPLEPGSFAGESCDVGSLQVRVAVYTLRGHK